MRTVMNILAYSTLLLTASCKQGFEAINYGSEPCSHCKMTIVDPRYAAEMITAKGRVYKFDDVLCMKQYADYYTDQSNNASFFVAIYDGGKEQFINASKAVYLRNDFFKSPMNGNYAAFADENAAKHLEDSLGAAPVTWVSIK